MAEDASILRFPVERTRKAKEGRSCWTCKHLQTNGLGDSYCPIYGERIDSEIAAGKDCPSWEDDQEEEI